MKRYISSINKSISNTGIKRDRGRESKMISKMRLLKRMIVSDVATFIKDEEAIGTVELILILVVLIGLVVIFRDQLTTLVNTIFERIASDSAAV